MTARALMAETDNSQLAAFLVRYKFLDKSQLQQFMRDEGPFDSEQAFVKALEAKGLVTSFQAGLLAKREFDQLVLGDFRLLYRNASGSFARVYRACSISTGRMLGLKLLRGRYAADPTAVEQFRQEAELGRSFNHENIVPIFEVGRQGDQHYFTMEFVEGGNLRELLNIRKKFSPREATKAVLEMAQGLEYALQRGAMHRDLKLTNVLMSSTGVVKLVDFGLAGGPLDLRDGAGGDSQRSIDYATLERGTNAPRDDPRSDLYFLGAMYYELVTGISPHERTRDRDQRGQFSRYSTVRPIRQVDPSVPRAVAEVVEQLMQLNPNARYQHPREVVRDLKRVYETLAPTEPAESVVNGHTLRSGSAAAPTVESPPAAVVPKDAATPTILCVELREKQQNLLRQSLSKRGLRVLMLTVLERAADRVAKSPPHGLLLMLDGMPADALDDARQLVNAARQKGLGVVVVLGKRQGQLVERFSGPRTHVCTQPISLHNIHAALRDLGFPLHDEAAEGDDTPDTPEPTP